MSVSDLNVQSVFSTVYPTGMRYKGDWVIAGLYQKNDVVMAPNNSTYICIAASGSTGVDPSTAPAAWTEIGGNAVGSVQSLNGQAGAITLTGSGITVGSTGAGNISLTNAGVLTVTAGSGINISGAGATPQVNNSGILSLTGSGNIAVSVGQNPVVSVVSGQIDLVPGATASGVATGPSAAAGIIFPSSGSADIPVVVGGLYCITGTYNIVSTAVGPAYALSFVVENGASDVAVLELNPNTDYTVGASLSGKNIPFCVYVIPSAVTIALQVRTSATATGGDTVSFSSNNLYINRIM